MGACINVERCPFFHDRMANMPGMASIYKDRYCMDDYANCARWLVARKVGRENVPADLFPNQRERVELLIAD